MWQALGPAPVDVGAIIDATGLSVRVVQIALMELELAGRLETSLQQVVSDLERQLDEQLDSLAEWLPRLVYALVVGFVISRLL